MYTTRRKGAPENRMELNPMFKDMQNLKKSWMLNGLKGVVTSGQDPTHVSFQLVKRKRRHSDCTERTKR